MSYSDRVRKHVYLFHIRPAFKRGVEEVEIRAGDIHGELQFQNRLPLVCGALDSKKFQIEYGIELIGRRGPRQGANVYFTYRNSHSRQPDEAESASDYPGYKPEEESRPAMGTEETLETGRANPGVSADIAFVSCVKTKRDHACAAKALYVSDWFLKARKFVEGLGCDWYILSAKHGLVHPDTKIQPYDLTLKNMRVAQRRKWSEQVLSQIMDIAPSSASLCFLAGMDYREFLVGPLRDAGMSIAVPMKGLRQGEQKAWLDANG